VRFQNAGEFRDALEQYLFAPALHHGPTLVEVPERPQVITLGGTPHLETSTPPAAAFAPPPQAFAPAHDPFAPPPEMSELPLEIVLPKAPPPRTVAAPMTQPSVDPHPLHHLRQPRRAAMAPQIWGRGIMTALGVVAALFAIVIWWTHEPTPPGRAVVTRPRAVITLANLPEEAFVWLDGTRTFLN